MKMILNKRKMTVLLKKTLSTFLAITLFFVLSVEAFALLDDGRNQENTTVIEFNEVMRGFITDGDLPAQIFINTVEDKYAPLVEVAQEVTQDCVTQYDKAKAIYEWICGNIYYDCDQLDYYEGTSTHPENFIFDKTERFLARRGVCQDYSLFYEIMCDSVGLPCVMAGGLTSRYSENTERTVAEFFEEQREAHAWNLVYADGRWMIVDCTWDSNNIFYDNEYHKYDIDNDYFDCSIELLSRTRLMQEWNFSYLDFSCRLTESGRVNGTYLNIYNYTGNEKHLVIPSTINGVVVDEFADADENFTLKSIYFSEGISIIDVYQFSWLCQMYVPVSTTEIEGIQSEDWSQTEVYYAGTPEQWNLIKGADSINPDCVTFNATEMTPHNYVELTKIPDYPCADTFHNFTCTTCGKQIQLFRSSTTSHTDNNGDGTCDVCGYNPNGNSSGGEQNVSFLQKLIDFFNRIIDFFRSLFK